MKKSNLVLSLSSLLIVNVAAIVTAVYSSWNVNEVIWVFYLQSWIVGVFQFLKIATAQNYIFDGTTVTKESKKKSLFHKLLNKAVAVFYSLHFFTFLIVFGIFFVKTFPLNDYGKIFPLVILFFINHLLSFIKHKYEDQYAMRKISYMISFPYARIIPMHLFILFSALFTFGSYQLILFMIMKTGGDMWVHIVEHRNPRS